MRDRAEAVRRAGMAAVLETTIKRWFTAETERDRPQLIDRVCRTLLADDPLVHGAMWDMIAGLDLVSELHRIACPTLILVGEFDPSSPPAAARVLEANIRDAEMHIIEGASRPAQAGPRRLDHERDPTTGKLGSSGYDHTGLTHS